MCKDLFHNSWFTQEFAKTSQTNKNKQTKHRYQYDPCEDEWDQYDIK